MKNKLTTDQKGFTLLFAILVSTLVLSVGASIISIALKQTILSGIGRESQYAFYATNTGIECALYWDYNRFGGQFVFPLPSSAGGSNNGAKDMSIKCAENSFTETAFYDVSSESGNTRTTKFRLTKIGDPLEYCVDVYVVKTYGPPEGGGPDELHTVIQARGYNTCDPNNPRRVERGLKVDY